MIYAISMRAHGKSCMTGITSTEMYIVRMQLDDFCESLGVPKLGSRLTAKRLEKLLQDGTMEWVIDGHHIEVGLHTR